MDSDMLVVGPIEDALFNYGEGNFLAAPETFPPDTFNSGFMVIRPCSTCITKLESLNKKVGSVEGGDQGVLNNGLCPNWYTAGIADQNCGRLPWIFNVQAANYESYRTLCRMGGSREPSVIHFVGDGKPWTLLLAEYTQNGDTLLNEIAKSRLIEVVSSHILWRKAFFRAIEEPVVHIQTLLKLASSVQSHNKTCTRRKLVVKKQKRQQSLRGISTPF
jgi:lipopolysaccharide biosynthesis glycosyltransferase